MRCYYFLFTILIFNCSQIAENEELPTPQTGDLLFQQWDESDFAKAINAVTFGADNEDYAHVGLVLSMNDTLQVLEAVTNGGVVLRPLDQFLHASVNKEGNPRVAIGRLQVDFQESIPDINSWALSKVGMPYDTLFIYGNDKYYCSELIHDAFNENVKGNDVFEQAPMTYIDPVTNNFFPIWETYFKEFNQEIPEGKLGINPGLMSRSKKIDIIAKLWE